MTITITIPDSAIPAEQYRVDQFNAGSGQPPLTIQEFAQLERDEVTSQRQAQYITEARLAMAPIADALIAGNQELRDDVLGYAAQKIAEAQSN